MKFTCDSCNAQYMISDDKVGPTGVKVRCKKCGHVITVRRAEEAAAAGAAPAAPASSPSGDGLDQELGNAFDSAFGDKPPPEAPPAPDLDATQAMSPEDAKRIAAAGPGSAGTEWYVAIGEAQVGPLPIADVKRKWEQGDIGPDSLCWRPGMGDWSPLSTVAELASVLSPIPRPAPRAAPAASAAAPRTGTPAHGTPAPIPAPASTAAPDATWKPAGASALAALASEELQARQPAVEPAKPAPAKPAGARSLVEQMNLSEGGIEPTGALPLSIKGVERTDESPIRRKSSVAARQAEVRQKRGTARVAIVTVAVVVVIVGVAVYFGKQYLDRKLASGAVAEKSAPAPVPAATPPAPQPVAPPPAPPPAPAAVAVATPAVAPPAPAAPEPAPAAEPAAAPAAKGGKAARGAKAAPPPPPAPRVAVAKAEPPPPPPPPPPAKPKGKSDSLLDGIDGGGDDALAAALGGGGGSGRSVYVPPKPGGSAPAQDQVTDGQITEGIKGRFDSLAACGDLNTGNAAVIVMRWAITPEGASRDVKCAAPCGNAAVAGCLAPIIKGIKFPRTTNGRSKVEFPFKF